MPCFVAFLRAAPARADGTDHGSDHDAWRALGVVRTLDEKWGA